MPTTIIYYGKPPQVRFEVPGSAVKTVYVGGVLVTPASTTNDSVTLSVAPGLGVPVDIEYGPAEVAPPDTGTGLPAGGTSGQVLAKNSGTDGDAAWVDPAAGGSTAPQTIPVVAAGTTTAAAHANRYVTFTPTADISVSAPSDATGDASLEWTNTSAFSVSVTGVLAASGYKLSFGPNETFYATRDPASGVWRSETPAGGTGAVALGGFDGTVRETGYYGFGTTRKILPAASLAVGDELICEVLVKKTGTTGNITLELLMDADLGTQVTLGSRTVLAAEVGGLFTFKCWVSAAGTLSFLAAPPASENAPLTNSTITASTFDAAAAKRLDILLYVPGAGDTGTIVFYRYKTVKAG